MVRAAQEKQLGLNHLLTVKELDRDFQLEKSLKYGHLPSVFIEEKPKDYLESYVKTYLEEEIQHERLTRNLGAFSRFLEAASFSQASILNISTVARECGVERKVVENYFSILEDLLIAYRIPCFGKRAKRRVLSHPKFYFFDVGMYRTIRPAGPLDLPEEIEGHALETLFLQELKALNDYFDLGYNIYYWRTADDLEVDFVLYGDRGIKAFEIKRAGKINSLMLRGLKSFQRDYPSAKTYFLYGGKRRLYEDKIEVAPFQEILPNLINIL